MSYGDILDLGLADFEWYAKKLGDQRAAEAAAIEAANRRR